MKKIYYFLLIPLSLLAFSCNLISDLKIENLSSLIENLEEQNGNIPQEKLDELELKMEELQNDLEANRDKYTEEQVKEIGKLQGRYAALLVKKGLNEFSESMKDLGNQIEGFIEGLVDDNDN